MEVNFKFVDEKGCWLFGKVIVLLLLGLNNVEIEEIIIFGEIEIMFCVR